MTTRRVFLLTGGAALGLAACAPMPRSNPLSRAAASNLTFSGVTVSTSGAGYENSRAAQYSSRLGPDLQGVLAQEFSSRIEGSGGARMEVDVARLNLANSARTAFGGDQSRLQGTVRLIENGSNATIASYVIDVVAGAAAETRTGALFGAAVNSSDRFYRQLLTAFADQAREQIEA
ncbi:hypothetical protein [Tranquillimonas rosea]|uniref:hypothetical protein n=1 Tax=Tranquillimonas rosea TaxID=641238 RepID=UPI003BAD852E